MGPEAPRHTWPVLEGSTGVPHLVLEIPDS